MGKRSNFKRVERDFYPTPREAVLPLLPHLPEALSYWEPCAGDGALLQWIGADMVWASDIEPRDFGIVEADALEESAPPAATHIITNPPWTRDILHQMIEHFSNQRPTWLLFDADWIHTKQASPYLPRLRKIVAVGRVRWIPDSKFTGKDNCAWHLFTSPQDEPAQFFGRVV